MSDLISRQAALDALIALTVYSNKRDLVKEADNHPNTWIEGVAECIDEIEDLPSAQPVRHGKWLDLEAFKRPWFRHHIFECSVCRNTLDMDGVNAGRGDANYCPNCGAKMDAERKEE